MLYPVTVPDRSIGYEPPKTLVERNGREQVAPNRDGRAARRGGYSTTPGGASATARCKARLSAALHSTVKAGPAQY